VFGRAAVGAGCKEVLVKRQIIGCLFVFSALGAGVAYAQSADSTAARVDTIATSVDTTAVAPAPTAVPTAPPPAAATAPPATTTAPPATTTAAPQSQETRVYYGGSVIVSFGDVNRIGIYPMIAYKFNPKLSLGVEVGYEWLKYDNFDETANNYGGSVFARYRFVPRLYGHAEYQMVNYEIFTSTTTSEREWVPFLLLGGGFSQPMGANAWTYFEVLFDVLNDDKSPYDSGEPFISIGVGVGF
jgi:hypothetical protein